MNDLRSLLALVVVFVLASAQPSRAVDGVRTNINPALIYWQAQADMPDLTDAEHHHLLDTPWRGRALDEETQNLLARYDASFRLLQRALLQRAPCDWGYDVSVGPELDLPSLAKAKSLAQTARVRFRWELEQGNPHAARDDFHAAFVLTRQVATDGILISALVQYAMENILTGAIAENWHRLDLQTLQQIVSDIDVSPARGTVADCIPAERAAFGGWLIRSIEEARAGSGGDLDALSVVENLVKRMATDDPTLGRRVVEAAGGTVDGVVAYIHQLDPLYDEADRLMRLPYADFLPAIQAFNEKVKAHPNLLVHVLFPLFENCRLKEIAADVKTEMVRAAAAYRQAGPAGLEQVLDPVAGRPFAFRRFTLDGADRGFELSSAMDARGWVEALIFVERDGPPFQIEGKDVGSPQ